METMPFGHTSEEQYKACRWCDDRGIKMSLYDGYVVRLVKGFYWQYGFLHQELDKPYTATTVRPGDVLCWDGRVMTVDKGVGDGRS